MDRKQHPKVVRTWMAGKIRKPAVVEKNPPAEARKPERHNKT